MAYTLKELFLTVQGEGANLGRVAVFVRFAGCNLWSGREQDRASAVCRFCDTDFLGGARYADADALALAARTLWPGGGAPFCVLTGGEPLLQLDRALAAALRARGFTLAVETNGTLPLPCALDWVCVSPKAGAGLALRRADELKLVFPQPGLDPAALAGFEAAYRWLSPMDRPGRRAANTEAAASYCLAHPEWRLAIQAHKSWGLP
ncbi:MAG: 7-carboxy-7-deazaguanine synthase [Acetobacteraceae bacterium]|nr:7-carboxy-7-deazaguanine synthase [Acetobacteraceae bacterium]